MPYFDTQIPGGTTAAIAQTTTTAVNDRFCGRYLGTEATVQANVASVCSKYIDSSYFQLLQSTVGSKKVNHILPYVNLISSFLAASVPYTIGVHMDDIEEHAAIDKGNTGGSEQVVAPGKYLYQRILIQL